MHLPSLPRYLAISPSLGLPFLNSSRRTCLRSPLIYPGNGKALGGPLVHLWSHHHRRLCCQPVMLSTLPTQTTNDPAIQICKISQNDLLHTSGYTPARRAGNWISPWQYLAVAGPVPRPASSCLKIRWKRCTKFRYLRSIPRFNQNSESVDFGLSSPGSLTHSPILLTHLVRTVPRPWFSCSVRPRLVPSPIAHPVHSSSGPSTALVSPPSPTLPEQRPIASDFQTANGRGQSLASPTSACADDSSARVPMGHFPRPTRDRDTRPDGLGHLVMTVHKAARLGNPSGPNVYARTAHLPKN